jgi:ATP-dependent Zn protease
VAAPPKRSSIYAKITTVAESDVEQLARIARQMVGRWGMSEKLGQISLLPRDGSGPLLPGVSEISPHLQSLIDQKVQCTVEEAHTALTNLLRAAPQPQRDRTLTPTSETARSPTGRVLHGRQTGPR